MCGRFSLGSPGDAIAQHFDLHEVPTLEPRYNIAPTQELAVVGLNRADERTLGKMRWGIPQPGRRPLINLRNETAVEAPKFRRLLARRRCLVVADGYYEWQQRPDRASVPHYIRMPRGEPFGFAGVWTRNWQDLACAILTCRSGELLSPIHERMPVILYPPYDRWLEGAERDPETLRYQLQAYIGDLEIYPVSERVGNVANDDPQLADPVFGT